MSAEEARQKQGQIRHELLVPRVAPRIGRLQVHGKRNYIGNLGEGFREHMHQPLVIVVRCADLQPSNLRQTLQRDIAEFGHIQESGEEGVDDRCFEYVPERDPVQEAKKGFQRSLDQTRLIRGIEDLRAQLEDGGEFLRHRSL